MRETAGLAQFAYRIVDVFTEVSLEGNPLAVLTDARGIDAATMQRVAREFNLSETVFVLPAERAGNAARLRVETSWLPSSSSLSTPLRECEYPSRREDTPVWSSDVFSDGHDCAKSSHADGEVCRPLGAVGPSPYVAGLRSEFGDGFGDRRAVGVDRTGLQVLHRDADRRALGSRRANRVAHRR